jgi:short-subunit dehydrogenase
MVKATKPLKALITGGTSGLGLAIGKILLEEGHEVAAVGLSPDHAREARELFSTISEHFHVYALDLAETLNIKELVRRINEDLGGVDLLINNAGYATYETFEDMTPEECDRLFAVNLLSHVRVTKLLLPQMVDRHAGLIVNISSIAGEIVITPNSVYMAAKQSINAWSKALSYELHHTGIKVKLFCPGRVATRFFDHPTFQRRVMRKEMQGALPTEIVARKIVSGIFDSSGFLFHIPLKYSFVSWVYRAVPFVERYIFRPMMIARTTEYYRGKKSV